MNEKILIGIATISIIIAILLYLQILKTNAKLKRAVYLHENEKEVILQDYKGKEISKKIKIKIV